MKWMVPFLSLLSRQSLLSTLTRRQAVPMYKFVVHSNFIWHNLSVPKIWPQHLWDHSSASLKVSRLQKMQTCTWLWWCHFYISSLQFIIIEMYRIEEAYWVVHNRGLHLRFTRINTYSSPHRSLIPLIERDLCVYPIEYCISGMETRMLGNTLLIRCMALGFILLQMATGMKDPGMRVEDKDSECTLLGMGKLSRGIGKMGFLMSLAHRMRPILYLLSQFTIPRCSMQFR